MNYRFLPEAETEYLEAIAFYQQRNQTLAAALVREAEHAIQLPTAAPVVAGSAGLLRRKGLGRDPYSLIYRASPQLIQIAAFAHDRKRPTHWVQRLPSVDAP